MLILRQLLVVLQGPHDLLVLRTLFTLPPPVLPYYPHVHSGKKMGGTELAF